MPSIFESQSNLIQCPFLEVAAAAINAAPGGYYCILACNVRVTDLSFKSTLDNDVQIYLVNPKDQTQTKQPWLKLSNFDVFYSSSQMPPQWYIPAGTLVYVKAVGAAPTTGVLRIVYFGN